MTTPWRLHLATPIQQLPASPLREWLNAGIAARQIELVAVDHPHCDLTVALRPAAMASDEPAVRFVVPRTPAFGELSAGPAPPPSPALHSPAARPANAWPANARPASTDSLSVSDSSAAGWPDACSNACSEDLTAGLTTDLTAGLSGELPEVSTFQLTLARQTPPATFEAVVRALIELGRLRRAVAAARHALAESRAAERAACRAASLDFLTGLSSRFDWEIRFANDLRAAWPAANLSACEPRAAKPQASELTAAELTTAELPGALPYRTSTTPATTDTGQQSSPVPAWAVMVLDLDGLGTLNRAGGMEAGDQWLRVVGERLRAAAAPHQTLARWGGDEFIAAWPAASREVARTDAQRLYAAIADLERNPKAEVPLESPAANSATSKCMARMTASAGWTWDVIAHAEAGEPANSGLLAGRHPLWSLIRRAERALFRAKDAGGRQLVEDS